MLQEVGHFPVETHINRIVSIVEIKKMMYKHHQRGYSARAVKVFIVRQFQIEP